MSYAKATPEEVEDWRKAALDGRKIHPDCVLALVKRIDCLKAKLATTKEWVGVGGDDLIRMTEYALEADREIARLKEIETAAMELCLAESGPVGRMLDEIERLGIETPDQIPADTVMGFLTDKDDPLSAAFVKLRATLGIPEEDDEPEES